MNTRALRAYRKCPVNTLAGSCEAHGIQGDGASGDRVRRRGAPRRVRSRLRAFIAGRAKRAFAQPRRQVARHGLFQGLAHRQRGGGTAGVQAARSRRRSRLERHPRRRARDRGLRDAPDPDQQHPSHRSPRPHRLHQ